MSVNAIISAAPPILAPQGIRGIENTPVGAGSFGTAMTDALNGVEAMQSAAHASAASFMSGETGEIHKVALDQQKAAIAFDLFLQVRNKVISAYQEIMKMQV
jgi:flagellar hook-basal body complex protein FliE